MEEDKGETVSVSEVAPALIAVHPLENSVAVAVGSELRVFDLKGDCPVSMLADSGGPSHSDTIRDITFCPNGSLFASAGDDKLVKIWRTDTWSCVRTVFTEKRVSAVAISCDGLYVTFADKFGLVWLVSLGEDVEGHALVDNKPVPILGHYCSIITSMKFSPDGRFIATADRDFKIRITLFPKRPLKGAHEIQSFCLGHTDYVSCLAFAYPSDQIRGFLLSGSGDSTVRLWNFIDGILLDTCEIGAKAGLIKSEESKPAVTDICTSQDGSLIAVTTQSLNGVILLNCDFSAKSLSVAQVITMEKSYIPTSLALSSSTERLWTVMGASKQPSSGSAQLLTCLRIMSGFGKDSSDAHPHDPVVLQDNEVPGGEKLLLKLQGSLDVAEKEEVLRAAAAALRVSMHNMLIKKQYSVEKREARKSSRNDKKLKK
uniref:tRNA (guanine-N(7)-)-methyltransferase non-catalytic subunit n=1 Tax=Ananas comosus var. bracteatus TaxID=296719 RepID=A0A6V7QY52_ANACO